MEKGGSCLKTAELGLRATGTISDRTSTVIPREEEEWNVVSCFLFPVTRNKNPATALKAVCDDAAGYDVVAALEDEAAQLGDEAE